ncbi:hypothetical protein AB0B50_29040 [Streptomyces sp. NPDC041068]|uniref:hypothetical protein n=1 Tax=Streptomyces sp. NPDC041068 TaxID=3155130 RepID=UPI0033C1B5C4
MTDGTVIAPALGLDLDLDEPGRRVHPLKPTCGSGSADNVEEVHTVNAFAQATNETWKLKVRDRTAQDTGCINS